MKEKGFTLVELSIVLVIIGLLIGGILAAQSMIDTVKVQRVIRELQQYQIMTDQFGIKFNYLPGDFPNAQTTFGSSTCPDVYSNNNICNGNGDGLIAYTTNMYANAPYNDEENRFWQHMKLAGIIQNCVCDGGLLPNAYATATTTTPASSYAKNARWVVGVPMNGQNYLGAKPLTNYFELTSGGGGGDIALIPDTPIISPINAEAIDSKIDDGIANMGSVLGTNYWGGNDTDANPAGSHCGMTYVHLPNKQYYDVKSPGSGCNLAFELKVNF